MAEELSDADIVAACKDGHEDQYPKLIERHWAKAFQIPYGILQDRQDAEEVVQDSFIKMYRVMQSFRGDAMFTTWMFRIVTNYAKNKYRWNRCRGSKVNVSINAGIEGKDGSTLIPELAGTDEGPGASSSMRELEEGVWRHLEKITPLYREVLIMRNVENRSYEDIAQILDCKIGTVKSRIARGREELRDLLEKNQLL
jgi:RNA polymerase sigma-70 factor (ECF subfamily)